MSSTRHKFNLTWIIVVTVQLAVEVETEFNIRSTHELILIHLEKKHLGHNLTKPALKSVGLISALGHFLIEKLITGIGNITIPVILIFCVQR